MPGSALGKLLRRHLPKRSSTIRTAIRRAISRERRMAASLIRLHFHDCCVQGCDASILLDPTPSFTSEKDALGYVNSARGFDVIEDAKSQVEKIYMPGVVSCSDVLAVAARDASAYVGGPSWTVKLGRRDSTSANQALSFFKSPPIYRLLTSPHRLVQQKGSQCQGLGGPLRTRIHGNGTDVDAGFASTRRRRCPATGGDGNLAALDLVIPNSFDNNYFKNLIQKKGLLQSDQVLFAGGSTDGIVTEYSKNPSIFSSDFAAAMVKIRKICSLVN
ncbi:hypothetical protein H6P81_014657 [Aristolochia fimbriata]|uniref:Plant heme peroxidase family profile domain-containing protein n=1 Tax=Aristolochia fimbriata TaxID=158543 RepID=A0AAV7E3B6_ARIFI|nr:hypothetical protein H6P81_014657 [Aristolochia fimbriata]